MHEKLKDYQGAVECIQDALAMQKQMLPLESPIISTTQDMLASIYQKMGSKPKSKRGILGF
jgi:hypothetical protein